MKYRILKSDEIVQRGDEVAERNKVPPIWHLARNVGQAAMSAFIFRRRMPDNWVDPDAAPKQDPSVARMVRATKLARGRTRLGKLEKLIAERIRWQRKLTVAQTKLGDVNKDIATLAAELARDAFEKDLSPCTSPTTCDTAAPSGAG